MNGIEEEDLVVALSVFYDDEIINKGIGFSLDFFDEKNPRSEYQKKKYYPDVLDGKKII